MVFLLTNLFAIESKVYPLLDLFTVPTD